ncbi:MAG: galactokinase [Armatimonadetes bacterium]|nr:galactokinase [Armatimonadota bacterium]MCX7967746.1 galactokinase [Armatimonadota bacterium]MDW8144454.1 galactokinase [Armatimonadota bacterium]
MLAENKSYQRSVENFRQVFSTEPEIVTFAPGRVNLIGEHTDYNEGFVLPIAVDIFLCVAAKPRNDRIVRVVAADLNDSDEFSLDQILRDEEANWRNYHRGVAWAIQQNGIELKGIDAVVASDIPMGAGLSSSAAIEVGFALTFLHFVNADVPRPTLAQWCQLAEHKFAGVQCGIMDQMIALLGKSNHALLLDCRDLSHQLVPLPKGIAFVVADTGVPRTLAASEYNIRRQQCEEAVQWLSKLLERSIKSLRDVTLEELAQVFNDIPDPIRRRARHVITENNRVWSFQQAMREGALRRAGALLLASHASLRDDYEVSCRELDAMVQALTSVNGVFGARLTGAGFGGACLAMVHEGAIEQVFEEVPRKYKAILGNGSPEPKIFAVHASEGATVQKLID